MPDEEKVVLRVPIEIIAEDSEKLDEILKKLERGSGKGGGGLSGDSASDIAEAEKVLEKTKLGEMLVLSKEGVSNLLSFGKNPSGFILGTFMRKFAKGAGAIALAFIIMEAIKFGLEYLTKDGMPWDRRFKRIINLEIAGFLDRLRKAQLRQGFRTVITTTIGGLRGGKGQVSGNIFAFVQGNGAEKLPFAPNYIGNPYLSNGTTLRIGYSGHKTW
jgi:hypothetical protein